MKVKTIHKITTIGPVPNKSYNPSIFIPKSLWTRVQSRNSLTIKGLVMLGWRAQKLKDVKLLDKLLSYEEGNIRRLIDILSIVRTERRKIHLKFMSRESNIATRIYEQHLKLCTTVSNYLLYLLIVGFYLNARVVLNYSTSDRERSEAIKDESILKEIVEKIISKRIEKDSIHSIRSSIIDELAYLSRRAYIRHVKKIRRIENPAQLTRYIIDNILFNIRPGQRVRYYVKICIGDIK